MGTLKLIAEPSQTGLLATATSEETEELTVTVVVPTEGVQPGLVTVTVYTPERIVCAPPIEGLEILLLKPFGPCHNTVAPGVDVEVSTSVVPAQIGLLLPALMDPGAIICTFVVRDVEPQPGDTT